MVIGSQFVLGLVALICLLGGLNLLNKGAMAFLPKGQPPAKELDNLFGFTSGIYFAMGFLLIHVVFNIARYHTLLYFLGNVVFFAGLGRAWSMLRVGSAGNYHRAIVLLEMGLGAFDPRFRSMSAGCHVHIRMWKQAAGKYFIFPRVMAFFAKSPIRMNTSSDPFRPLLSIALCAPILAMAQPADAGPDVMVCGDQYDMVANAPAPPGSGVWTLISGCGFLLDDTAPDTHVYGLCPGSSQWRWSTVDASGTQTSDVMEIVSFNAFALPADAGQDVTITDLPGNMELNASNDPTPPMICTWTLVTGTSTIVDPHDPNTMVVGLTIGDNTFRWTCDNGPCGLTSDDVNIQFMMGTGIGTTVQDATQLFRYDSRAQQLVIDGTKPIEDLMITDALGRSMPLSLGPASTRTWNVAEYSSGLYVLRAMVDARPQVYRFVVER